MWKKGKLGGKNCIRGNASLKTDQVGILKDICKALTKSMIINSLNYNLAEKLI